MENIVNGIELFELTAEEKSAIELAFETVVAEAAAAQQEFELAAEPIEREAQEKKRKLWEECEAARQLLQPAPETAVDRHRQAVKPLEDKICSIAEAFKAPIRTLMESINNALPARLFDGLNGEAVWGGDNNLEEMNVGAMLGPVEIAEYNIGKHLVPRPSEADLVAHREAGDPSWELFKKRDRAEHEIDCQLGDALCPFRKTLSGKLEAAKSKYDNTVQALVRGAMLRAGLDVTDIRLDRQIGDDDDDE